MDSHEHQLTQEDLDADDYTNRFSAWFELVQPLGKGAFGSVFEVIRKSDRAHYAVKVIHKNSISKDYDKLRQEAVILSELKHPNIVRFKDIKETDKRILLVMELVRSGTLKDLIKARKKKEQRFTEEETSTIIRSILSAVAYLHDKGIVHRDLKPGKLLLQVDKYEENILIEDLNDLSTIKIADFGLSAQFAKDGFMNSQSFTQKCGTMIYMAPELAGSRTYSKPVDIWSCGIIMYMLLSGGRHPLYRKEDTPETFLEKLKDPKWDFGDYFSPYKLAKNLFLKLVSTDPLERYTAEQAANHPWLTGEKDAEIPFTAHERMTYFNIEQNFARLIKIIYFLNYLRFCKGSLLPTKEYQSLVRAISKQQKKHIAENPRMQRSIMVQDDFVEKLFKMDDAAKEDSISSDGSTPISNLSEHERLDRFTLAMDQNNAVDSPSRKRAGSAVDKTLSPSERDEVLESPANKVKVLRRASDMPEQPEYLHKHSVMPGPSSHYSSHQHIILAPIKAAYNLRKSQQIPSKHNEYGFSNDNRAGSDSPNKKRTPSIGGGIILKPQPTQYYSHNNSLNSDDSDSGDPRRRYNSQGPGISIYTPTTKKSPFFNTPLRIEHSGTKEDLNVKRKSNSQCNTPMGTNNGKFTFVKSPSSCSLKGNNKKEVTLPIINPRSNSLSRITYNSSPLDPEDQKRPSSKSKFSTYKKGTPDTTPENLGTTLSAFNTTSTMAHKESSSQKRPTYANKYPLSNTQKSQIKIQQTLEDARKTKNSLEQVIGIKK